MFQKERERIANLNYIKKIVWNKIRAYEGLMEPSMDVDKLSYENFSILESMFLFGYDDSEPVLAGDAAFTATGKGRILSVDSSGGLHAAVALARLESSLWKRSGDPAASIADFFEAAVGSGAGGALVAMLFAKGPARMAISIIKRKKKKKKKA